MFKLNNLFSVSATVWNARNKKHPGYYFPSTTTNPDGVTVQDPSFRLDCLWLDMPEHSGPRV